MWSKWLETTLERMASVDEHAAARDRRQRIEPAVEIDSFNHAVDLAPDMPVELND